MTDPIIITGIPRSGTSIIAEIFSICGAFTGKVDSRFENEEIKQKLMKPYLASYGVDPLGQRLNFQSKDLKIQDNWREHVQEIMLSQGYQNGQWIIKSNLVIPMWPIWFNAFPEAKFIIVRRRTGDIVNSCMKTGYMDAYDNRNGWIHMCRDYISRMSEMVSIIDDVKVVWPHRMAYGDYRQVWEFLEWTDLPWKSDILSRIDPKFLKIRKNH